MDVSGTSDTIDILQQETETTQTHTHTKATRKHEFFSLFIQSLHKKYKHGSMLHGPKVMITVLQ